MGFTGLRRFLRARRLEAALDTPAHIYYKYEGVSPAGSHKPNTAIAQAYYNREEGTAVLVTETGAGQWGSALSMACRLMGLETRVYIVRISYEQKPFRKLVMQAYGAQVHPSPSDRTPFGREFAGTEHPGSLGIAITEAIQDVLTDEKAKYALGSVLNHVLLHQTVIGEEAYLQMQMAGEAPTILIGAVGGGSNFAGLTFPFIGRMLRGEMPRMRVVAVEPAACPSLTKGEYRYDFGDTAGLTPLLKMHTLGHDFVTPRIHAGGCATMAWHLLCPISMTLVTLRLGLIRRRMSLRQVSSLPGPRALFLLPKPPMPSKPSWTLRSKLALKMKNLSFSSISAGMVCWTSMPMRIICKAD